MVIKCNFHIKEERHCLFGLIILGLSAFGKYKYIIAHFKIGLLYAAVIFALCNFSSLNALTCRLDCTKPRILQKRWKCSDNNLLIHNQTCKHGAMSQEPTDTLVFIGVSEAAQEYIKDNEASH